MEYFYCHLSYGEDILNSRSVVPHSFDIIYSHLREKVYNVLFQVRFQDLGKGGPSFCGQKLLT